MRSASEIREAGWTATLPSAETKWPVKSRSRAVLAKSLSDAPIHPLPRVRRLGERADSVVDRRTFLAGTGAVLLAAPLVVEAQQAAKVYRVGYLSAGSRESQEPLYQAFLQGLSKRGWVDGQNLIVERSWAEGRNQRLPALAAELVQRKVEVIVAAAEPAALAATNATKSVPIVMLVVADPVGSKLVASLARPGGNVTGMTFLRPRWNSWASDWPS